MVESPDRTQVIQRSCADLRKDSPMECGVPSLSQIVLFTKDSLLVYIGHVCPKWIHLDLGCRWDDRFKCRGNRRGENLVRSKRRIKIGRASCQERGCQSV